MEAPKSPIQYSICNLDEIAASTPYIKDEAHAGKVSRFIEENTELIRSSLTSEKKRAEDFQATRIGDDIRQVRQNLKKIFTVENERSYPDLAHAHRHLDALQHRVDLHEAEPEMMQSLDTLEKIIDSYQGIPENRGLRFIDDERFVSTKYSSDQDRLSNISRSLEVMVDPLTNVKRWLIENRGEVREESFQWIEEKLIKYRDGVDHMMREFPTTKIPPALQKAHAKFHELTPSEMARKAAPLLDECTELMAVQDFEIIEAATDLFIASSEFHTLLEKDDLRKIGAYIRENRARIQQAIDLNKPRTNNFDTALTWRKQETGLARTLQIIIPQGAKTPEESTVVIQLKQHGKIWKASPSALKPATMRDYRDLQTAAEAKELKILGEGGYKMAKNSVAFPFDAIDDDGHIDETEITHTTSLTPKNQSKEHMRQSFVQVRNVSELRTIHELERRKILNDFNTEILFFDKFKGRGVLPLVGSSIYNGKFELRRPGLLFFFGEEKVSFSTDKINIITKACDGDLTKADESWTFQERKQVALDVIHGLIRIHDMGYRHHDIKPGNVLYKRDAEGIHGYLCDFGAARERGKDQRVFTDRFLPVIDDRGWCSLELGDCYAMGLTVASLMTTQIIFGRMREEWEGRLFNINYLLENEALLNNEARNMGVEPSDLKKLAIDHKNEILNSLVPVEPKKLLDYIRRTENQTENPLAYAYALTHLHSFEKKLTKADIFIIENYLGLSRDSPDYDSSKSPITKRGNLTSPILKKLYDAIEKADHADLDFLLEPMSAYLGIDK